MDQLDSRKCAGFTRPRHAKRMSWHLILMCFRLLPTSMKSRCSSLRRHAMQDGRDWSKVMKNGIQQTVSGGSCKQVSMTERASGGCCYRRCLSRSRCSCFSSSLAVRYEACFDTGSAGMSEWYGSHTRPISMSDACKRLAIFDFTFREWRRRTRPRRSRLNQKLSSNQLLHRLLIHLNLPHNYRFRSLACLIKTAGRSLSGMRAKGSSNKNVPLRVCHGSLLMHP